MNHYYQHPAGEPICSCARPSTDIRYSEECMSCMRLIGPDVDAYASPEAQRQLQEQRASSYRELSKLTTADRFRLMFGQPSIQETNERIID